MFPQDHDTIAAIATAAGPGGVAIVRLSGPDSIRVLTSLFAPLPAEWPTHVLRHGFIKDAAGQVVDEVLAVVMRAPRSYTAEDVVEIHTHGGRVAVQAVLDLCLQNGARLAEPGAFTKRAFLNGRLDLTQAEAVADMVNARTDAALRAAQHQLSGELFRELGKVRERLMTIFAALEALLNFPEEDTDRGQAAALARDIDGPRARMEALLATAPAGKILREGVRLAIVGRPNVGKSSLLNALLRHDRAIVTDIAGTTRDTLEETANIGGIPVNCMDTAGILVPRDRVEEEAVRRSYASLLSADIVALVLDASVPVTIEDRELMGRLQDTNTVVVLNKTDLPETVSEKDIPFSRRVRVSAVTRNGMDTLERTLIEVASRGHVSDGHSLVLTKARHVEALRLASSSLQRAAGVLQENAAPELASEEIRTAIRFLDQVTGRDADADLIDQIFRHFCIGK